jgi:hypothetical protein
VNQGLLVSRRTGERRRKTGNFDGDTHAYMCLWHVTSLPAPLHSVRETIYIEYLIKLHKTKFTYAMTDDKTGTEIRTATTGEIPHFHMPHIYADIFQLLKLTSHVSISTLNIS